MIKMSEEEKKAIETLKGLTVYYDDYSLLDEEEIEENNNINKSIQLIIDLIEKQQKEIEEAIEYIENAKKELYGCGNYYLLDLLKILKGVKDE